MNYSALQEINSVYRISFNPVSPKFKMSFLLVDSHTVLLESVLRIWLEIKTTVYQLVNDFLLLFFSSVCLMLRR